MASLIVCGMDQEAVIARACFPNSQVVQYQHIPGFDIGAHVAPGVLIKNVWSWGLCGGNAPGFPVAAIGVARSLTDGIKYYDVDQPLMLKIVDAANNAGMHIGVCPWLSSTNESVGDTVQSRAALLKATGAWADDDETYYAALYAESIGAPFGVVRSVSDDWRMNLPEVALNPDALNPDGSVNGEFIAKSLLENPGQIPDVVRVAYDYQYSLNTLKYAGTILAAVME